VNRHTSAYFYPNHSGAAQRAAGEISLLLGNAFSRAYKDIFNYKAVFEQADFAKLDRRANEAFLPLKTHDSR
jgi:hypothetical protein